MSLRYQLTPSILSFDPADFKTSVEQTVAAGVDWIHLDVMDGQFVPPITFGADLARRIVEISGNTPVEAHLMTLSPETHFGAFIDAGCRRIVFHQEVAPHAHRLCGWLRSRGVQAGVAINPGTDVETLRPLLDEIDLALVMTVNPGWGGQKFIESCLAKTARLREWRPALDIQVDGGIDPNTLPRAAAAGVNVFVSGSFLTKGPIVDGVAQLKAAYPQHLV